MISDEDKKFMKKALLLAKKAEGLTSPNPLVGAVIVKNSMIISKGYHKKAGKEHAEVLALENLNTGKKDLTLYVNLEPCSHFGRTPPCTDRIINSGRIKRVVIGMRDPNPLVSGSGIKKLKDAGIKVDTGVLKKESVKLNEVFIKHIVSGYPFIVLKTAVTVDGKTATETGDSMWITGEKSRKYVHRLRSQYDAVLTGIGTVLKDNPELTVRAYKNKRNPVRIIADSRGRIPPDAKVLRKDAKTIIACTNRIKDSKLKRLKKMNIDVLICREKGNRVYIKDLLKKLSKRGITSILLESGSELNASFLDEGLVDKLLVFIAPKLIGGKNAPGFVSGKGIELMKNAYDFTPFELKRFNNDILLETYFKKNYEKYYL